MAKLYSDELVRLKAIDKAKDSYKTISEELRRNDIDRVETKIKLELDYVTDNRELIGYAEPYADIFVETIRNMLERDLSLLNVQIKSEVIEFRLVPEAVTVIIRFLKGSAKDDKN